MVDLLWCLQYIEDNTKFDRGKGAKTTSVIIIHDVSMLYIYFNC